MTTTATRPIPAPAVAEIDAPYALSPDAIAAYQKDGCIKLSRVLSAETLALFEQEFTAKVIELNTQHLPLEKRNTYARAFLQVGNLCFTSETVKRFVFGKRLARIASELMGCRGVRLYHDQALYKEAAGGHTPWHCDQQYWPLDNPRSITAWIPLQAVPIEMGPLAFSVGSQVFTGGRHLDISDESEEQLERMLSGAYEHREEPFALGDVSFHAGWTYHRARGNSTGVCRKVMTIIYMDQDTRVAKAETPSQENDRLAFFKDLPIGALCETPLTPVIYTRSFS
ncbi:MAG: phytanoyl-CoA dioxygenase family protein [Planctomycetes bacterium]|nr:phytanoyl-CoA dioxygenase family protein [Planctomycetota bacterium]